MSGLLGFEQKAIHLHQQILINKLGQVDSWNSELEEDHLRT